MNQRAIITLRAHERNIIIRMNLPSQVLHVQCADNIRSPWIGPQNMYTTKAPKCGVVSVRACWYYANPFQNRIVPYVDDATMAAVPIPANERYGTRSPYNCVEFGLGTFR